MGLVTWLPLLLTILAEFVLALQAHRIPRRETSTSPAEGIPCPPPTMRNPQLIFLRNKEKYLPHQEVTVQCHEELVQRGQFILQCRSGQWVSLIDTISCKGDLVENVMTLTPETSPPTSTSLAEDIPCPPPTMRNPQHIFLRNKEKYPPHQEVVVQCQEGLVQKGQLVLLCSRSGQWVSLIDTISCKGNLVENVMTMTPETSPTTTASMERPSSSVVTSSSTVSALKHVTRKKVRKKISPVLSSPSEGPEVEAVYGYTPTATTSVNVRFKPEVQAALVSIAALIFTVTIIAIFLTYQHYRHLRRARRQQSAARAHFQDLDGATSILLTQG